MNLESLNAAQTLVASLAAAAALAGVTVAGLLLAMWLGGDR